MAAAGLDPTVWGPYVWGSIHSIAIGAPDVLDPNQKNAYRILFNQLPTVIPCHKCQQHLHEHLSINPVEPHLDGGGKSLFAWSVALHNSVNKTLNKKEITLEEATAYWKNPIAVPQHSQAAALIGKAATNPWTWLYTIVFAVTVLLIIYLILRKQRS